MKILYLDGLRAVAATYVVLFHIWREVEGNLAASGNSNVILFHDLLEPLISHGTTAVVFFIVLSGYCLSIKLVKQNKLRDLQCRLLPYLQRRCTRILPAYYAVLMMALFFRAVIPTELQDLMGVEWKSTGDHLAFMSMASHVALVHNFFVDYMYSINGPMWSVAWEWQIYFLLPLIFVPVLRKAGLIGLLVSAALIATGVNYVAPYYAWYIFSFAVGVAAAISNFSDEQETYPITKALFCKFAGLFYFSIWLVLVLTGTLPKYMHDVCISFAFASMLHELYLLKITSVKSSVLSFLENNFIVFLGTISYSIYLTHSFVLGLSVMLFKGLESTPLAQLLALLVAVLPVSLVLGLICFNAFEKPFINLRKRKLGLTASS